MENRNYTLASDDFNIQRNYKDTLFRFIFKGENERSRRWLLSLYNALRGSNYTDTSQLEVTTLEDVIYVSVKNDLSFLINDEMNLFEHQSTVNPNMPIRGLLYFSRLYMNYIRNNKKDIYRKKLIQLPTPKYVVFYNGEDEIPDISKYYLSDAFINPDETKEFEWTATVININKNHNSELQKMCRALYDYSEFVARIRQNMEEPKLMPPEIAVKEAVDYAIEHNFLEGFFEEEKGKIVFDILTQFDKENYDWNRRDEGFIEGKEAGAQQKAIESAINLLKEGDSAEKVSRCIGLPIEKVLELKSQLAKD